MRRTRTRCRSSEPVHPSSRFGQPPRWSSRAGVARSPWTNTRSVSLARHCSCSSSGRPRRSKPRNCTGSMMVRMAEEQIAWTAVKTGEAVGTSDGATIGQVVEVAALASEDIFHGIVFEHAHSRKHYLAPAADIERITTEAVHLSVDAAHVDQ